MNENLILRSVSLKKVVLVFYFLLIAVFFHLSFSAREDSASFLVSDPLEPCHPKQETPCGVLALHEPLFICGYAFLGEGYPTDFSRGENLVSLPQDKQVEEQSEVDIQVEIPAALGKMSKPYYPIIIRAANRYKVDPSLVKAIIMAESGYDPQAVSTEGAAGLMQLMPRTAEALGVEDAFKPEHNVDAGVKYLKQLLEELDHDVELALAAYNVGIGMVRRHQGIPPIKATQYYIKKVFAYYHYYKNEAIGKTDSV
ncbi:MAG: hypothetical protein QG552_1031 [Thermodesulfobacteriota bacterium]|nr:hypothetical protein [Thermodesulfobacteriota bacterium]